MKKWLAVLLVLCLGTGLIVSSLAWQRSSRQAEEWRTRAEAAERRAAEAASALETCERQQRLLALENDPIAAFFSDLPYSGATAGYLASLEIDAYRAELENAASLLQSGTDSALPGNFLRFIDTQAQMEADAWTTALETQGAGTAGAWAHVAQCQTPVYRFGAYTLISAYQRTGDAYSFLFDPETARQLLLDAGIQEEDLPAIPTD